MDKFKYVIIGIPGITLMNLLYPLILDLIFSTPSSNLQTPAVKPPTSMKKPESVSTVTSVAPYQTFSSIYNGSATEVPSISSRKTSSSSNQVKLIEDVVSNDSNNDSDDNNDGKKNKKHKQHKEKVIKI